MRELIEYEGPASYLRKHFRAYLHAKNVLTFNRYSTPPHQKKKERKRKGKRERERDGSHKKT